MVMRTMRASAKWIMGIVAVAFVGWMVFDVGLNVSGQGATGPNVVARVNGQKIDVTTFYTAVRNQQEQIRQQGTSIPTSIEEVQALEDQVLEQLVQEMLLAQEYRRLGISVTDDEVIEAARTSPPPEILSLPQFQTEGQFDIQKYQRFISSSADPGFLFALEQRYRDELPFSKFVERVTAGIYMSDAQLWRQYRDRFDSVTAVVLALYPSQVIADDAVQLSDTDLREYYRAHRESFERPATAYLSFIALSRRTNAADSAAALERVQAIHAELAAGAAFDDVARRESVDSVSAADGGNLGEVAYGRFVPAFDEAVRALRPGQLSTPVLTSFGYHIIRVDAKTDTSFTARHVLIPIELVGEHLDEVESRADTLDLFAAEQDDPAALDDVAARLNLPLTTAPPLPEGERLQLGRFLVGDAGAWAFDAEVGQTSPVIETDWAYYVFRLDTLAEGGVPPFERAETQVRLAAIRAAKERRAQELGREIAAELLGGSSLEEVAARRGLQTRTVGPLTRYSPSPFFQNAFAALGAAFALEIGETSGPIRTPAGTFFVRPTARMMADSAAFVEQLDVQRVQAIRQARQQRVQLAMASIRASANVQDLRRELARAQQAAEERSLIPNPLGF